MSCSWGFEELTMMMDLENWITSARFILTADFEGLTEAVSRPAKIGVIERMDYEYLTDYFLGLWLLLLLLLGHLQV
jgi:hypothetical protein